MSDDDRPDDEHADAHDAGDEGAPEPGGPRRHPAIFAPNWRTVLAVDAGMGVVLLLAGVVLAVIWNPVAGGFMGSLGLVYVVLVVRRGQDWSRQRREAGL